MTRKLPHRLQAAVSIDRVGIYNWVRGIDIYPTPAQFADILANKPVTGVKWH